MFLAKEAVRLATDGTATGVACDGCPPPLADLVKRYEAAGGRYYVCPICFNAKQLSPKLAHRWRRTPGHGSDVGMDRRRSRDHLQLLITGTRPCAGEAMRELPCLRFRARRGQRRSP